VTFSLALVVGAIALAGCSGLPGLFCPRPGRWGQKAATWLVVLAAVAGIGGAAVALAGETTATWHGIALDALSAWFLVPVFLLGALGSVYGESYWPQASHPVNGRRLRLFWGWLMAGMGLLLIARHGVVFLVGWETMALTAFFVIATEDEQATVRSSAWAYLVATHLGTLSLFSLFALLRKATGSFALRPLTVDEAGIGLLTAMFLLALVGFGLKAGIMPLHFWLPGAHANAPSHVSAFLSGVLIKMGVYGLVRILGLLPAPPVAWGVLLLAAGVASALGGVLFAIAQHDLKRLLAYHSVENIGIIVMGLGLAVLGRATGHPDWVLLGLAGCLLHVWNHSLFKGLLFLAAGAVVHATGTREIDALGGLGRRMPWTAAFFATGAVAICGLPPLNGFVSELLIYLGLLRTATVPATPVWPLAALSAPALAMVGALAVACFVKVFGAVFLGLGRTPVTEQAHEAAPDMRGAMAVLAAFCLLIGLAPGWIAPLLSQACACASPGTQTGTALASLAPFAWLSAANGALLILLGIGVAVSLRLLRRHPVRRPGTWDCGYAQPTARIQYTASSFAQFLSSIFGWLFRAHVDRPRVTGAFPAASRFASHVPDLVLDRCLLPMARTVERWLGTFRRLQQGLAQSYLLYILVAVLAMLVCTMPLGEIIKRWFCR